MRLFRELVQSLKLLQRNKADFLFLFFQLLVFQGSFRQFDTNNFIIINLILCLAVNLFRDRLTIKGLFTVVGVTSIILILPTFQWGISNVETFVGFFLRIITAFLIISYYRINFLIFFENLVFILAIISIPLFIIQIININVYNLFDGFSERVLPEEMLNYGFGELEGHRYLIIFNVNSWAELRNSGFAGEPAAFGALLSWAALINHFQNKFKINARFYIYLLAGITTFSISTYVAFLFMYILLVINIKQVKRSFYIVTVPVLVLALFSIPLLQERSTFMMDKIDRYSTSLEDADYKSSSVEQRNRIQGMIVGMNLILNSPFGYSIDPDNAPDETKSSNGFMLLIYKFGILGLLLALYLLKKLFDYLKIANSIKAKGLTLFVLIVLITFNGNPFYNQPFFLAFLLAGFLLLRIYRGSMMIVNQVSYRTSR